MSNSNEWGNGPSGGFPGGGWTGGQGPRWYAGGPPPWLAGLFGRPQADPNRGQRVRRGDVRAAILDVLATGPMNGYQIIGQIAERSGGAWRPSPGSVYPTISQLEDEGLIIGDEAAGRRTLKLTPDGESYVVENLDELARVWSAFSTDTPERPDYAALKPEIGRVMSAVWQIITQGTDKQVYEAMGVLVDTRRALYKILSEEDEEPAAEQADE